jgi:A/G-specific adenine glycosylase
MSAPGLRTKLLRWYDAHARDLPWRRTRDPYAIWVSEIMLQQTRVETVIPYFERFLARLPTVRALAEASEDEVLSLWSGLGYYRRARLLHRGAKAVRDAHDGRVPEDVEARLALPGVGRYTSGAIGSIAFDRQEPLVDGNVARVLARLFAIDTPLGRKDTEARLWREAELLVRGPRPGALNQALMELGATVCTPTSPRCDRCPVGRSCAARAADRVAALPVPKAKRAPKQVRLVAVVAQPSRDDRVWLVRGEGALFGGLFGVPMAEGEGAAAAEKALAAHGLSGRSARWAGTLEHVLTHRRLVVEVHVARASGRASSTRRLFDVGSLETVGVSTLTRKILALAAASVLGDPATRS